MTAATGYPGILRAILTAYRFVMNGMLTRPHQCLILWLNLLDDSGHTDQFKYQQHQEAHADDFQCACTGRQLFNLLVPVHA